MKTSLKNFSPKQKPDASVLIAVLGMLAIMFVLFTVNSSTLNRLSREVDALNRRQTNHLATINAPVKSTKPQQ
jgi:hypothetical protein